MRSIEQLTTLQATWVTEAKRRRDEVLNGTVTSIPGEEAFAQVRQLKMIARMPKLK